MHYDIKVTIEPMAFSAIDGLVDTPGAGHIRSSVDIVGEEKKNIRDFIKERADSAHAILEDISMYRQDHYYNLPTELEELLESIEFDQCELLNFLHD